MCNIPLRTVCCNSNDSAQQVRVVWKDQENLFLIPCRGRVIDDKVIDHPYPVDRKSFEAEVDEGEWFVSFDPYEGYDSSRATEKKIEKRDRDYSIVQKMWTNSRNAILYQGDPKEIYEEAARQLGCSTITVQRKFNRYLKGGMTPDAMLDRTSACGARGMKKLGKVKNGKGDHTVTQPERVFAENWLNENYMNMGSSRQKKPHSVTMTYRKYVQAYLKQFQPESVSDVMSEKQFRHLIQTSYSKDEIRKVSMEDYEYASNHRILTGCASDEGLGYAGMAAVTDSTDLDIHICTENGDILERPTLTSLMDQQTGIIMGINVTLGKPSAHDFVDCLVCCNQDKAEYAKQHNMENFNKDAWLCKGFPRTIYADNGEIRSQELSNGLMRLGIEFKFVESCRGDEKGRIERWHRTINEFIHECPGAINKGSRHDDRLDATLTFEELQKLVINIVQYYNLTLGETGKLTPSMISKGYADTPAEWYRYYQDIGHDMLTTYSPAELRKKLYFRKQCSVDRYGVHIGKLFYTSENPDVQDYFKALISKKCKATVAYGTRTDDVWLVYQGRADKSETLYPLVLNTAFKDWNGLTDDEVQILREKEKDTRKKVDQNLAESRTVIMSQITDIQQKPARRSDGTKRKAQRIAEIADNTTRKRQEEGYLDAFDGFPTSDSNPNMEGSNIFEDDEFTAYMDTLGDDSE